MGTGKTLAQGLESAKAKKGSPLPPQGNLIIPSQNTYLNYKHVILQLHQIYVFPSADERRELKEYLLHASIRTNSDTLLAQVS